MSTARTVLVVGVALTCFGDSGFASRAVAGGQRVSAILDTAPSTTGAKSKRLTELLEKRRDAAQLYFELKRKAFEVGGIPGDELYPAALRLLDAELELHRRPDERRKACETCLKRMKDVEDYYLKVAIPGARTAAQEALADYYRLEAEVRLEREKGQ
jgi:hypothetical protein